MSQEHQQQFRRGIEQFNTRHFFEAHETWEEIWLASPEPRKTFLQGIIQVAAAFHHYGRGNHKGTRSLLEAGLRRLANFPPSYCGLHLDPIREAADHWVVVMTSGGDPGPALVPTLRPTPHS